MAKKYDLFWSEQSKNEVNNICAFLERRWSAKERQNFIDLLFSFQNQIINFPKAFKVCEKKKKLRVGLIHKNCSAVYKISRYKIIILNVFDNRMNDDFR